MKKQQREVVGADVSHDAPIPLPLHIRGVANTMDALADRMAKEGGAAAVHALELSGAAGIARGWADGIEKEAEGVE